MTTRVVVLGAGYAGAGSIPQLEDRLPADSELVWISDTDYQLVLHESHRIIRDPGVKEKITIPVEDIKSPTTEFVHDRVVGIDVDSREISLETGDSVDYDYLIVVGDCKRSPAAKAGLGSVTQHVILNTNRAVTVAGKRTD